MCRQPEVGGGPPEFGRLREGACQPSLVHLGARVACDFPCFCVRTANSLVAQLAALVSAVAGTHVVCVVCDLQRLHPVAMLLSFRVHHSHTHVTDARCLCAQVGLAPVSRGCALPPSRVLAVCVLVHYWCVRAA